MGLPQDPGCAGTQSFSSAKSFLRRREGLPSPGESSLEQVVGEEGTHDGFSWGRGLVTALLMDG